MDMSFFGIPSEISALQATQAQKVAAKARARERGVAGEDVRRRSDEVELGVSGLEDGSAIRKSDEEAREEHSRGSERGPDHRDDPAEEPNQEQGPRGIDFTA